MKRDGFTLVEILMSITLVSIVLVSMLGTLVKLKDVYANSNNDTEIRVYGAAISRAINNDIIENLGINVLNSCSKVGSDSIYESTCEFSLNNAKNRRLTLRVVKTDTLSQDAETGNKYITTIARSTLEYYDIDSSKVLLIKTVYSKEVYSVIGVSTKGSLTEKNYYNYTGLTSLTNTYTHVPSGVVKLKSITISASDPEFNIVIYSGGTYSS